MLLVPRAVQSNSATPAHSQSRASLGRHSSHFLAWQVGVLSLDSILLKRTVSPNFLHSLPQRSGRKKFTSGNVPRPTDPWEVVSLEDFQFTRGSFQFTGPATSQPPQPRCVLLSLVSRLQLKCPVLSSFKLPLKLGSSVPKRHLQNRLTLTAETVTQRISRGEAGLVNASI